MFAQDTWNRSIFSILNFIIRNFWQMKFKSIKEILCPPLNQWCTKSFWQMKLLYPLEVLVDPCYTTDPDSVIIFMKKIIKRRTDPGSPFLPQKLDQRWIQGKICELNHLPRWKRSSILLKKIKINFWLRPWAECYN